MFDARSAKSLAAGEHIIFEDQPGLRLKASGRARSWIYRYKSPVDGRMRQVKIGDWPAKSYAAAAVEWEKLRQKRDAGEDPAMEKRELRAQTRQQAEEAKEDSKPAYTVADLCEDYCLGHTDRNRAKKGATEVRRLFEKELGDLAGVPACTVSRSSAFALISTMAGQKPVIAGKMRTELGAAWEFAIDAGKIPEETPNWWRQILRGKIRSKGKKIAGEYVGTSKRVLSSQEIGAVLNWLPNMSQLLQDTLTLYLWTVCRGAEIVKMEGREINQEEDGVLWWVVPKHKTKNARFEHATDLRVPLYGRAALIALRRKERFGQGFLFPKRNDKNAAIEEKTIQSQLFCYQPYSKVREEHYLVRLPVSHWAPHDLRRSSRTLLAAMGCEREIAESIMGHMLPGVEGVYNLHRYDNERKEWLKRLSDRLEQLTQHSSAGQ